MPSPSVLKKWKFCCDRGHYVPMVWMVSDGVGLAAVGILRREGAVRLAVPLDAVASRLGGMLPEDILVVTEVTVPCGASDE